MDTSIVGCVLGAVSLLLGLVCLALIIDTRNRPMAAIEGAFRSLESQVAKQWEAVESGLGRISRLKREVNEREKSTRGEIDAATIAAVIKGGTQLPQRMRADEGRPFVEEGGVALSRHDEYARLMGGGRANTD